MARPVQTPPRGGGAAAVSKALNVAESISRDLEELRNLRNLIRTKAQQLTEGLDVPDPIPATLGPPVDPVVDTFLAERVDTKLAERPGVQRAAAEASARAQGLDSPLSPPPPNKLTSQQQITFEKSDDDRKADPTQYSTRSN